MASIRSNLNSVSSTTNLAAIKKRWTTCLQNRLKKPTKQQQQPQQNYCQQQQQQQHNYCFIHCNRECSFKEKTNEHLKQFKEKIKNIFSIKKTRVSTKKLQSEKVEIVAKLLSSTLIATTTTKQTNSNYKYSSKQQEFNEFNMTITEDTFVTIRDEYPDLDVEIRSILMSRAQTGATISDIRDDYFKATGIPFPIHENITEFLLTIPSVSAMCNARGTRIFNIVPNERTKHLYDLVVNQKPAQSKNHLKRPLEPYAQPNRAYFWRNNLNYKRHRFEEAHKNNHSQVNNNNNIDCNSNFCNVNKLAVNDKENININTTSNNNANSALQQRLRSILEIAMPMPMQTEPDIICPSSVPADKQMISSTESSEGFVENNWFYQDNCNYLFNRFCNQPNHVVTQQYQMVSNNNNNNDYHQKQLQPQQQQHQLNSQNTQCNNSNYNLNTLLQYQNSNLNNYYQQQQQQLIQQNLNMHNNLQTINNNINNNNNNNNNNNQNIKNRAPATFEQPMSRRLTSSPTYTKSSRTNDTIYTTDSDYEAHLLDFPLLGDDFFLYLARMELKCKFKKSQKILQSGLCVSGQTINAAIKRVRQMHVTRPDRRVIVNIGSVDIMQGKPLIQIEHELLELIGTIKKKGLMPILTTLAPLANYGHESEMKMRIERFNEFIKRQSSNYLLVIDIWTCLVNERGQILFGCFQSEPRVVTGAAEPYVFWNKIGRQRVLQLIESKIEY